MLRAFEQRLDPFPPDEVQPPPEGLARFLWACTRGARGYIIAFALLSAGVSIYEAWLFSFLGQVVDLLSTWQAGGDAAAQESRVLWGMGIVMLTSIGLVALRTMVQHQILAINLPLRLRWDFHRLMLRQSLSFFSDEFSGRVTTKVMQTALAVRDVLFTLIEIAPGIGVYFIAIIVLAGGFALKLMLPFVAWIVLFGLAMLYFVPRLGKVGQEQAHARSSMTGRISDAYTNITTVKLFSHSNREAHFARAAMEDFKQTFVEWAGQTINKSFWAGAYYRQQRAKGSTYQAAVRALAFKWIRILYRCWQTRTPYDETTYLNALRKRGSPLLKNLDLG